MNTITESQMNEIVHTLADSLEATAVGRIGIDRNELNEKLEYLLLDIRIKVVEDPKETP